jgi:diguanylate cyclase (GGDEF)-like protein
LLRKDIKNLAVEYAGQLLGTVTLSIGVAAYPEHTTAEELVRAADKALYCAKAEGRDRAVVG